MKNDIVMIIFKNGAEFRCVEFCPVVLYLLYFIVSYLLYFNLSFFRATLAS